MPKSSRAMRSPSRRSSVSRSMASSGLRTSSTSETSSSRHSGGRPVSSRTRRTSLTSAACESWRAETLTDTTRPWWPASCHFLPCRQAARSVHCPRGTASPLTSARETKSAALSIPWSRRQRRSDSSPTMAPVSHSTTGCQYSCSSPCTRARRSAVSFACRSAARARERGACTSHASPPRSLARRIATVALWSERLGVRPVVREEGDAEAGGHEEVVAADAEGAAQREAQLVRDDRHVLVALDAGKEDGEDVAGDAGDRVALSQGALEGEGDAAQEVVAVAAAEPLVHLREPVEAELDDGELLAVALRVDDRHRQAVGEAAGARQPGERVLVGEGADLLLRALAGRALAGERFLETRDARAQRADLLLELDLARGGWPGGSAALGRARARPASRRGRPRPGPALSGSALGGRRVVAARDGHEGPPAALPVGHGGRGRRYPSPAVGVKAGLPGRAREAARGLGETGTPGIEPGGVPGERRARGRVAQRRARAGQEEPRLRVRGAPPEEPHERLLGALEPQTPHGGRHGGGGLDRLLPRPEPRAIRQGRRGHEQRERADREDERAGAGQRPRPNARRRRRRRRRRGRRERRSTGCAG